MQKFRQLLRRRIPARAPVAVHAQAEANRINFLSHKFICSISCLPFSLAAFLGVKASRSSAAETGRPWISRVTSRALNGEIRAYLYIDLTSMFPQMLKG